MIQIGRTGPSGPSDFGMSQAQWQLMCVRMDTKPSERWAITRSGREQGRRAGWKLPKLDRWVDPVLVEEGWTD